jgi:hypothetical protein
MLNKFLHEVIKKPFRCVLETAECVMTVYLQCTYCAEYNIIIMKFLLKVEFVIFGVLFDQKLDFFFVT